MTVVNTTFARNQLGINGSRSGIATANAGMMTIINSTFAENRFQPPFVGAASIVATLGTGTTFLENDILVHSSDDGNVQDCSGLVISLGNNLITDPTACNMAIQLSDQVGIDAGLGDFADDGTPGDAHFELLPDSDAINGANSAACPKKDQIGQPRTAHCDIGSVEFSQPFAHQVSEQE